MARITVTLQPKEKDALIRLAQREYRDPRLQAALMIRRALEEEKLLQNNRQEQKASKVDDE